MHPRHRRAHAHAQAITYTPAMKEQLCEDWDGFEAALVRGHMDAQAALLDPKAVEKNSAEPPATGS